MQVHHFACEAVSGSDCEMNDHLTGERTNATYAMDRDLQVNYQDFIRDINMREFL